jgi:short-subunit dehydrogenase
MRIAIIIGATSGIGRGIAKIFSEKGYLVGITGRRSELLEEIRNENPDHYFTASFDVRDLENFPNYLENLIRQLGGLDLLILSSGVGERMNDLDFAKDKRILDTNVLAFTAIVNWAFNYFMQKGSGHLVAISSVAGLRGGRWAPSYSASKAYQINYLEGLRQKAKKMNLPVIITDIRPGFVDTALAQGDDVFWVANVGKASRQMFRAILAKKEVAYVTKRWSLIAVIMKIIPSWIYVKI